jgi:hypothetical protein
LKHLGISKKREKVAGGGSWDGSGGGGGRPGRTSSNFQAKIQTDVFEDED